MHSATDTTNLIYRFLLASHRRTLALFLPLLLAALSTPAFGQPGQPYGPTPIVEASKRSGQGANREGWNLWSSGACAERMGVAIGFVGRAPIANRLTEAAQYARDSAPLLVARCPQLETLEATVRGMNGFKDFHRFTLKRSEQWAPGPISSSQDYIKKLIDAGYQPVMGPKPLLSTAFFNYGEQQLNIVYGNELTGRMTAAHIERTMREDVPDQVSRYVVRGHWFDYGDNFPEAPCPTTRAGYPLWGSFVMTIAPTLRQVGVMRERCVDHGDRGEAVAASFQDLSRSKAKREGLPGTSMAPSLSAAFEAGASFAATKGRAEFAQTRQPFYRSANLRLYPRRPDLCQHAEIDAVYRINHESRDKLVQDSYERGVGLIIKRELQAQCGGSPTASVHNYRLGESESWDQLRLLFRAPRSSVFRNDPGYLRITDQTLSPAAKAHEQWLERNRLGPACADSEPFCTLPGGRYLNAIYQGDLNKLRQMDQLQSDAIDRYLKPAAQGLGALTPLFDAVLDGSRVQLLREAANKYLYSYPAWGDDCFETGAQEYTFTYTTPVVIETDEFGGTTRSGGERYDATYRLNPNFFRLRDKIGSAYGARDSDDPNNLPPKADVYRGIVAMKKSYGCRDPEVVQFERNLVRMTNEILQQPGTRPVKEANRPPVVATSYTDPFPPVDSAPATQSTTVAFVTPAALLGTTIGTAVKTQASRTAANTALPQSRPQARTRPGQPNARSRTQSREAGMAELQALNERMNAEGQALMTQLQKDLQNAKTPQEKAALQAAFNKNVSALQQHMQEEIMRLTMKYQ